MKISEIIKILEDWAPKEVAWDRDNAGLQVGSTDQEVKNIFISLDLNQQVLTEAIKKNCNFIITHHPLIFTPIKKINPQERISSIITSLIKNDITLYSSHTNLDYTKDGVSFQLANKLGLKNIQFLKNLSSNQYKLNVFVPESACNEVAEAVFNAGGGIIGNYSKCSFRTNGQGTFIGSSETNPSLGNPGEFTKTEEVKLEILTDKWKIKKILDTISAVHPYEELAYDLIPVENPNVNFGAGVFGDLEKELSEKEFLLYVAEKLNLNNFRYSAGKPGKIKKVALCGGAGIEYLNTAISKGCDAYITGDVKYHSFQEAEGNIFLADAGHYETEIFVLDEIETRLKDKLPGSINVVKYSGSTNPIIFYNN